MSRLYRVLRRLLSPLALCIALVFAGAAAAADKVIAPLETGWGINNYSSAGGNRYPVAYVRNYVYSDRALGEILCTTEGPQSRFHSFTPERRSPAAGSTEAPRG